MSKIKNLRSGHATDSIRLCGMGALVVAFGVLAISVQAAPKQEGRKIDAASPIEGMASITGTVDAKRPFKAAQVYIRNVEKRILYMVYTDHGRFRAVNLFPGNYEIDAQVQGMKSPVRTFVVKAGDRPTLKLSMRDAPGFRPSAVPDSGSTEKFTFQSYDEIYPAGPGKQVVEQVCMSCHSENFFPLRPRTEVALRTGFAEKCEGSALRERDKIRIGEGAMGPPVSRFRFGSEDRKSALDYLAKNFGADAKPRAVKVPEAEKFTLDEAKLGKAMYMEYYLNVDPSGQGVNAPEYRNLKQPFVGMRQGTVVQLDTDGNVWMVDRGVPNRLVKLDPRTGVQKDFLVPTPTAGLHDLLIDREGIIWLPEFTFVPSPREPRLLGFNLKTEQWQYNILADPNDEIRNPFKAGAFAMALDSKGNLYMTWLTNDVLGKRDRKTGEITIYRVPTDRPSPYGITVDRNDNIWVAEARTSKMAKLDTQNGQWTEFTPLTNPSYLRRSPGVDTQNNVWFTIYAAGNRPGKLAKIDQTTGRITEWSVPHRGAQPYEASSDANGIIWVPDQPLSESNGSQSMPATIARFDPKDESFTFYPKPQYVGDSSKLVHTIEGAMWYSPRADITVAAQGAAFGVFYPDMDKITSFAAYPQNGPPGYPFKTPGDAKNAIEGGKVTHNDGTNAQDPARIQSRASDELPLLRSVVTRIQDVVAKLTQSDMAAR